MNPTTHTEALALQRKLHASAFNKLYQTAGASERNRLLMKSLQEVARELISKMFDPEHVVVKRQLTHEEMNGTPVFVSPAA